ncbi:enoyl-CoA hydratase/isomerase [Kitasatospora sp. NBC_01287]|uniref:enoyl-CoA hydratase/isomerase n=1 Tax=Kitasatospora sp. NBC_01287 TaxID=2903573 RepID=UPI002252C300|nr:enoyl-CoA hydratase/isomerase [Kitasatospora sp. NBC_01287]MCX4743987.1 enoyl-CoA hydratase/isomerase [Kitasatospora sp. NBC_01287]
MSSATYQSLRVSRQGTVCRIRMDRPQARNAINTTLVNEFRAALAEHRDTATVVVVEGLPEVFCTGADFAALGEGGQGGQGGQGGEGGARSGGGDPGPLYDLWLDLATGPFVSIAHIRGEVTAGGVGFAAACDIALADDTARFSLSELLWGLLPACVLPFLVRRTGEQAARYLTLTTQPVPVTDALRYGLVDAWDARSDDLLRRHLLRLRRLTKPAVTRCKAYFAELNPALAASRAPALAANREVFGDPRNLDAIARYVRTGRFPWEEEEVR